MTPVAEPKSQPVASGASDTIPARHTALHNRLWVQLLAALVLVALVAVGIVAIFANRSTTREFELYVSLGRLIRAEQLVPELASYSLKR